MSNSSRPFAPGSISMRLYPHNELEAEQVVAELVGQAQAALTNGFDGVMTSEHHGGSPGYLPNPLQVTGFQLEATESGWAAPCPLLLPLRPTALVAEEVAWLDARHPGRVGLGVASGALPLDFEAMDVPLEERSQRFAAELPRIVDMLRGKDLRGLDGDPALRRLADNPIPVLSAAVSSAACRRAALCDAGILLEGMSSPDKLTRFCQVFDEAGGTGAKVLIRRVWIGPPNTELIERRARLLRQLLRQPPPDGDRPDAVHPRSGRDGRVAPRPHGPDRSRRHEPPGPPAGHPGHRRS